MNTMYEEIYELFFDRVINDKKFFVPDIPQEEFEQMAMKRAKSLLMEAIAILLNDGKLDITEINFMDRDDLMEMFNFELTLIEKQLLADIMLECYIGKDLVTLTDLKTMYFTDKDLKMYSPSEAKKVLISSYNELRLTNRQRIDNYKNRTRLTYRYKPFDYGSLG